MNITLLSKLNIIFKIETSWPGTRYASPPTPQPFWIETVWIEIHFISFPKQKCGSFQHGNNMLPPIKTCCSTKKAKSLSLICYSFYLSCFCWWTALYLLFSSNSLAGTFSPSSILFTAVVFDNVRRKKLKKKNRHTQKIIFWQFSVVPVHCIPTSLSEWEIVEN